MSTAKKVDVSLNQRPRWMIRLCATALDTGLCLAGIHTYLHYSKEEPTPSLWFLLIILVLYYFTMEVLFGKTVGKFLTGMELRTTKGEKPSLLRLMWRSLLRLGNVPFMFSLKRVTLLDLITGCRVVSTRGTTTSQPKDVPLAKQEGWR